MIKDKIFRLLHGHGFSCLLLGCRYPYWHGINFVSIDTDGITIMEDE